MNCHMKMSIKVFTECGIEDLREESFRIYKLTISYKKSTSCNPNANIAVNRRR